MSTRQRGIGHSSRCLDTVNDRQCSSFLPVRRPAASPLVRREITEVGYGTWRWVYHWPVGNVGLLVLLSQKVAADGEENHLFGKIHTSAVGRLEWVCRDQTMVKRGFRPIWRGSLA